MDSDKQARLEAAGWKVGTAEEFLGVLKSCCQRVVDTYLTLFNPPRENANLYCPECHRSIVYRAGAWVEHT